MVSTFKNAEKLSAYQPFQKSKIKNQKSKMVTTIKISEITYYRLISLLSHNIDIIPTLWYPTIEIYGKQNLISNNIRKIMIKKTWKLIKIIPKINTYLSIQPKISLFLIKTQQNQ